MKTFIYLTVIVFLSGCNSGGDPFAELGRKMVSGPGEGHPPADARSGSGNDNVQF